jgi:predicted DNA-binding protein
MSSAVVNKPQFKREQKYVTERIAELREELEDLIDYLDLLEARVQNFGKKRYSTEQVKKILNLK